VLARVAHDLVPADQSIDLLNVAFENPRVIQASTQGSGAIYRPSQGTENQKTIDGSLKTSVLAQSDEMDPTAVTTPDLNWAYESCPDRITGRSALRELQQVCPGRKWQFVAVIAI
jgi:hypothetical protein